MSTCHFLFSSDLMRPLPTHHLQLCCLCVFCSVFQLSTNLALFWSLGEKSLPFLTCDIGGNAISHVFFVNLFLGAMEGGRRFLITTLFIYIMEGGFLSVSLASPYSSERRCQLFVFLRSLVCMC
ncbi:hypothetical protein PSV09DRAFT_2298985 [Bipolaris maydis]|uniref:uncharacterized protein n=1 Tax=Cochliobolus heterostrophus TaxID=5016 RepID=UPI0024D63ABB|nr:hypothetical protein J3E74DRAFT_385261 [Bipolaris maydis]KAJ6211726.1 hypothetical protein PSV09DRAFT_2298985 [Bipolaris maydis]KAJ6274084.1 hypothetical protein PSV08DRAFT_279489 [Bipolaris maydis]KAJ6285306.1 hypothetical protein J3E71DRAFT_271788 [Bipolaris maydis]